MRRRVVHECDVCGKDSETGYNVHLSWTNALMFSGDVGKGNLDGCILCKDCKDRLFLKLEEMTSSFIDEIAKEN